MKTPKKRIDLTKGVFSNASVHDAPVVEQDNITTLVAGQATVRRGMRAVSFSDAAGASDAHQVYSLFAVKHPLADFVIWQDSNGDLHTGRSPS